jgi:peptidoglycan-N-acetylglucosamine deacetylase
MNLASTDLYWKWLPAGAGLAAVLAACWLVLYWRAYAVRSQILGKTFWRGASDSHAVALTFDDGPSADTNALLDTLAEHNVKAAFFLIGREVEKHPEIARRIVREGHEIGNHSYSHPIYLFCSARKTASELSRTQEIIEQATGVTPRLARPPCGVRTRAFFKACRRLGLTTIQWEVAGFDWKKHSPNQIAEAVLKDVRPGSIILLHDGDDTGKSGRRATVEAIPLILDGLKAKNLKVAPLREVCPDIEKSAPIFYQTLQGEKQL